MRNKIIIINNLYELTSWNNRKKDYNSHRRKKDNRILDVPIPEKQTFINNNIDHRKEIQISE